MTEKDGKKNNLAFLKNFGAKKNPPQVNSEIVQNPPQPPPAETVKEEVVELKEENVVAESVDNKPAEVPEAVSAANVVTEKRAAEPVENFEPKPEEVKHLETLRDAYDRTTVELSKIVVGQTKVVEQLMVAILARGHCLLEGVPGLAKTLMIRSLSQVMNLSFRRIQFTPDLMPADITGTEIIQEDPVTNKRNLVFQKGPIFTQMLLADEINRTPPKTQAALLEAMQEHSVTVGGKTYQLQEPFFVLATQNPIEQEGTYPLPEAQRDRFLFHVKVDYPDREEEREIVRRTTGSFSTKLTPIISGEEIIACQDIVRKVPVPDHVFDFVLDIVRKSRPTQPEALPLVKELIEWGPGPRACQCLILGAKVRAVLRKRFHVTIDDVQEIAYPVLRHRIVPTFNAEAEGISVDEIIKRILEQIPTGEKKKVI